MNFLGVKTQWPQALPTVLPFLFFLLGRDRWQPAVLLLLLLPTAAYAGLSFNMSTARFFGCLFAFLLSLPSLAAVYATPTRSQLLLASVNAFLASLLVFPLGGTAFLFVGKRLP